MRRLPFEPLQHNLDAAFAYAIAIVTGMMDVLQSYDFDNCKLPTVGGGDLFKCVCGDKPLAIPQDKRFVHVSNTLCMFTCGFISCFMKIHDRKIDVGHCLTKFDEQGLYFFFFFSRVS